jgi:hypothetical protein
MTGMDVADTYSTACNIGRTAMQTMMQDCSTSLPRVAHDVTRPPDVGVQRVRVMWASKQQAI